MMTFDDFSDRLENIKKEFASAKGKELETIKELENYLIERMASSRQRGLKSLKGLL